MIGDARNTNEPSLLAAALDGAAVRVKGLVYQLQGRLQARFNLAWPAQPTAFAGTPVIPTVRYRDVPAAIAWLCRAFGMKVHRVETDPSGAPCYAELTIGSGMLMVAPIEDTVFGRLLVQPDEIGGVETQVCYLCVTNARAHHARAKAAGAVIVIDPDHEANKGRGYSCRDPEGHVWNFGTYDPWEKRQRPAVHPAQAWGLRRLQQGLAAAVLLVLASGLLFEVAPQPSARASTSVPEPPANASAAASLGAPPLASEPLQDAGEAIATEAAAGREAEAHKRALEAADRSAAEARAQLAEARGAIESAAQAAKKAERDATAARLQLDEMQRAQQAAERAAAEAREHLAAAQQSAARARTEAALERAKRIAADRAPIRAGKRASVSPALPRPRWARSWCYSPGIPNPASNGAARLVGFCKG
jgi:uncharacterized glyoxalase superfamily protein PhnB